jgi:hypothetical protein
MLLLVSASLPGLMMIRFMPNLLLMCVWLGWGWAAGSQSLLPETNVCDTLFM